MNYQMTVSISAETREHLRELAKRQGRDGILDIESAKLAGELLAQAAQREIDAQDMPR